MDTLFTLANLLPMPFWLMMILAPGWQWTRRLAGSLWPVGLLGMLYAALLVSQIQGVGAGMAQLSLDGIAAGFSDPGVALVGWVHYLAFDLFVGRWIYLRSRRRDQRPWMVSVCLLFTLLAGPLGLALYLGLGKLGALEPRV